MISHALPFPGKQDKRQRAHWLQCDSGKRQRVSDPNLREPRHVNDSDASAYDGLTCHGTAVEGNLAYNTTKVIFSVFSCE